LPGFCVFFAVYSFVFQWFSDLAALPVLSFNHIVSFWISWRHRKVGYLGDHPHIQKERQELMH